MKLKTIFIIITLAMSNMAIAKTYGESVSAEGRSGKSYSARSTSKSIAKSDGSNEVREMCRDAGYYSAGNIRYGYQSCKATKYGYACKIDVTARCYNLH